MLPLGASIEKWPLTSVVTPRFVPLSITVAPISGSPLASVITPVAFIVWATAVNPTGLSTRMLGAPHANESATNNENCFFISAYIN